MLTALHRAAGAGSRAQPDAVRFAAAGCRTIRSVGACSEFCVQRKKIRVSDMGAEQTMVGVRTSCTE